MAMTAAFSAERREGFKEDCREVVNTCCFYMVKSSRNAEIQGSKI
jgi:hypothetical protein